MTESTVNSLGQITVNAALENIDHWPETGDGPRLFQGPFGVLDFVQKTAHSHNTVGDAPQIKSAGEKDPGDRENLESFAADMHHLAGESESVLPATSTHRQLFEPTPQSTVASTYNDRLQDTPNFQSPTSLLSVHSDMREPDLSTLCADVPPRALELLRLFKANMLSLSFPLRGSPDCPWQTIHLPAAMSTYAELLINQRTSHHRLSLFHSLVSASCLYNANRSRGAISCEILRVSSQRLAKEHLELALEEEITSRNPVKYKELLMAILSMVYLEVCHLHLIL